MKKAFTFLCVLLISVSLLGQTMKRKPHHFKIPGEGQRNKTVERLLHKKPDSRLFFTGTKPADRHANTLKSTLGNKQKLDSIEYDDYDEGYRYKVVYYYNTKGNNTLEIGYDFIDSTNRWVNGYKDEYAYDAHGNLTQDLDYGWADSTNRWINWSKYECTYDVNENLTMEIYYTNWDSSTNQWINGYKEEYAYDADGNLTLGISYDWVASTYQWDNDYKYEFAYNTNGNLIKDIYYYWIDSTNRWVNVNKEEYAYDANGNRTRKIGYYWVDSTNQWVNGYKEEYAYDANGNRTRKIDYDWDNSTNQWVNDGKLECAYDVQGNFALEIDYDWDNSTNQWVNAIKEECTYNNSYSFTELLFPEDLFWDIENGDSVFFVHMLISDMFYHWNKNTNEWENSEKDLYYYSNLNITGVSQHNPNLDVKVYPNPATGYVVVALKHSVSPAQFELYNMAGQKVISQKIFDRQQIPISNLKSGIYFCKITYKGKIQTIEIRKK